MKKFYFIFFALIQNIGFCQSSFSNIYEFGVGSNEFFGSSYLPGGNLVALAGSRWNDRPPRSVRVSKLDGTGSILKSIHFDSPYSNYTVGLSNSREHEFLCNRLVVSLTDTLGKGNFIKLDSNLNIVWSKSLNLRLNHYTNTFFAGDNIYGYSGTFGNDQTKPCIFKLNNHAEKIWDKMLIPPIHTSFNISQLVFDGRSALYCFGKEIDRLTSQTSTILIKLDTNAQIIFTKKIINISQEEDINIFSIGNENIILYFNKREGTEKGIHIHTIDKEGKAVHSGLVRPTAASMYCESAKLHKIDGESYFISSNLVQDQKYKSGIVKMSFKPKIESAYFLLSKIEYGNGLIDMSDLSITNGNMLGCGSIGFTNKYGGFLFSLPTDKMIPEKNCCMENADFSLQSIENLQLIDVMPYKDTSGVGVQDFPDTPLTADGTFQPHCFPSDHKVNFSVSDSIICLNDCITIQNDSPNHDLVYDWYIKGSNVNHVRNEQLPDPICFNSDSASVILTASDGTCIYSTEKIIKTNYKSIVFPNAFTPNNDGINDFFYPIYKKCTNDKVEFFIFTRWGQLIFSSTNDNLMWSGKNNSGENAPIDVYLYQFTINDKIYKGQVSLIR